MALPEGFEPLFRTSPFLDLIGPIFNKRVNKDITIAFLAEEKHCNARGIVHGGMFSSLADIALGYNTAFSGEKPIPMVTVSLSVDYMGSAKLGDWIEITSNVEKIGGSMAFASCRFCVDGKMVAKASAVFKIVSKS